MKITIDKLASHLNGEVIGLGDIELKGVGRIESADSQSVTFLGNLKYESYLYKSKAAAVIINRGFEPKEEVTPTLIVVEDAYEAITATLQLFASLKSSRKKGRHFSAKWRWSSSIGKRVYLGEYVVIEKRVKIGDGCQIYPHVYIGDGCQIGENCIIYSGAKLYNNTIVGANTIIHSNAVIGADGFGFSKQPDGSYMKVPQLGNVVIGEGCEIGANTTIDRATSGSTIIEDGVKLDNLIQVAHNCTVGKNSVAAAQVGIAGSVHIGEGCMIGGQAGFADHITIADNTNIGAQAGILSSVKEGGKVLMGSPAFEAKEFLRAYSIFRKLHRR